MATMSPSRLSVSGVASGAQQIGSPLLLPADPWMDWRVFCFPIGANLTTSELSPFVAAMADAHRVMLVLDSHTRFDGSENTARPVDDGVRVYEQLCDYRQTVKMTLMETALLQTALDLLRARLQFFGEAV